jgi:hypothetical protein
MHPDYRAWRSTRRTALARACAERHPDRVRYLEHPARVERQSRPFRHPRLSRLVAVPELFSDRALSWSRAALRFALPSPAYDGLMRWCGADKSQLPQDRMVKTAHRLMAELAADRGNPST